MTDAATARADYNRRLGWRINAHLRCQQQKVAVQQADSDTRSYPTPDQGGPQ